MVLLKVFVFLLMASSVVFGSPTGQGDIQDNKEQEVWLPRELATFHLKDAAFVEVFETSPNVSGHADRFTLYITTFNYAAIFIKDPVYRISSPGRYLDTVQDWSDRLEKLGGVNSAYWPNYPTALPAEVSGFSGIVQTSGFLVPGKTHGQLEVYNEEMGTGPWNIASKDGKDWSYHWLVWYDIDGDGLKDVLTARFHVGLLGGTESQLVWLRNPGNLGSEGTGWRGWDQNVLIKEGPDVHFTILTLDGPDDKEYSVIIAGELWSERIMLYYVENAPGAWLNTANIQSVVIDDSPGQPFEASVADVNADGFIEVLASAYDTSAKVGNLYVYEMPRPDWTKPFWKRRVVATDFVAHNMFANSMTPGKHRLFYPSTSYSNQVTDGGFPVKPWISLSGDDDGKHYILYPVNENKTDWTYEKRIIIDTGKATSGTMAVADLDGDGYMEIVSAGFSADTVYVHTFAP